MAEQVVIRAHIVLDRQPHGMAGDEELDYFPSVLEDFLNSGDYHDYQLYTDNEIVLNSTKVKQIVKGRHMKKIRNSCEYEPWANGAVERSWRTLTACAREFLLRGFKVDDYESDGEEFEASEYWTYAVQQAANAYNAL